MAPLPPSSGLLLRRTIFCPDWMHLPADKSIIRPLTVHNRHRYFSICTSMINKAEELFRIVDMIIVIPCSLSLFVDDPQPGVSGTFVTLVASLCKSDHPWERVRD